MKFNVGDQVRVLYRNETADTDWVQVGAVGTVTKVYPRGTSYPIRVQFDDKGYKYDELRWDQVELATPAVYRIEVPPEPEGVTRVRPVGATADAVWERRDGDWIAVSMGWLLSWETLVRTYPSGLEPVPDSRSDYRVSLDYLRKYPHVLDGLAEYSVTGMHAAAVVRGVLAEEGLE